MNKKLIKASVAGAAAIALAAGGTTFAAWSDFGVTSSTAGAGIMKLNVSSAQGSNNAVPRFNLAPGQNKFQEMYLASADGNNVPVGELTAKIQRLVDIEDGTTCTTNSEAIAEGSAIDERGLPTQPSVCNPVGELSSEATVQLLYSDPVATPAQCPNTGIYTKVAAFSGTTLANISGKTISLGDVAKGMGVCLRAEMTLPFASATDASQGDDVAFDWRFDLAQKS